MSARIIRKWSDHVGGRKYWPGDVVEGRAVGRAVAAGVGVRLPKSKPQAAPATKTKPAPKNKAKPAPKNKAKGKAATKKA